MTAVSCWRKVCRTVLAVLCAAGLGLAAGGGKVEHIVVVADSRRFDGWEAWFTNLYNESLVSFALLTVIAIPVTGVILGVLADLLMARIGINLKSRDVAEH